MVDRQRQTNMFGYHYPFSHEDDVNEQNRWYQHFLSTPKNAMHRGYYPGYRALWMPPPPPPPPPGPSWYPYQYRYGMPIPRKPDLMEVMMMQNAQMNQTMIQTVLMERMRPAPAPPETPRRVIYYVQPPAAGGQPGMPVGMANGSAVMEQHSSYLGYPEATDTQFVNNVPAAYVPPFFLGYPQGIGGSSAQENVGPGRDINRLLDGTQSPEIEEDQSAEDERKKAVEFLKLDIPGPPSDSDF